MSSQGFEDAAEDFVDLKLEIERLLKERLPFTQGESKKLLVNDINRKITSAQSSLDDMQREVERAYVGVRPQLSYKLRTYQTEFGALRRQVEQELKRLQSGGSSNPFDRPDPTRNMYFPDVEGDKPSIWNKAGLEPFGGGAPKGAAPQGASRRNPFSFMSGIDPTHFGSTSPEALKPTPPSPRPDNIPMFGSALEPTARSQLQSTFALPLFRSSDLPPQSMRSGDVAQPMGSGDAPQPMRSVDVPQPMRSADVPQPTRDPGYFSESECSSNSSERVDAEKRALKSSPGTAVSPPIKEEHVQQQDLQQLPQDQVQPPQDVHPQDLLQQHQAEVMPNSGAMATGAENWRIIKPPKSGNVFEAAIVPPMESFNSPFGGPTNNWSSAATTKPSISLYKKPEICVFCKNNGEDETVYKTHTLMSTEGKVICPILYAYRCPLCHTTGDYAHTLKYCPRSQQLVVPSKGRMPVGASGGFNKAPGGGSPFGGMSGIDHNSDGLLRSGLGKFDGLKQAMGMNRAPQPPASGGGSVNSIENLQHVAKKIVEFTTYIQTSNVPQSPETLNYLLSQYLRNQSRSAAPPQSHQQQPPHHQPPQQQQPPPADHFLQNIILRDVLDQISEAERHNSNHGVSSNHGGRGISGNHGNRAMLNPQPFDMQQQFPRNVPLGFNPTPKTSSPSTELMKMLGVEDRKGGTNMAPLRHVASTGGNFRAAPGAPPLDLGAPHLDVGAPHLDLGASHLDLGAPIASALPTGALKTPAKSEASDDDELDKILAGFMSNTKLSDPSA